MIKKMTSKLHDLYHVGFASTCLVFNLDSNVWFFASLAYLSISLFDLITNN
jgi:hypothetical protein